MSKKLMRILNGTARKNLPPELKPAATRTSCPYCMHSMLIGQALNNGVEWGQHDDSDFTCPDCKETLVLAKPAMGGELYFIKYNPKPNYAE